MNINRHELLQEIILRQKIQQIIKNTCINIIQEKQTVASCEQKLRVLIREMVPKILLEDTSQTKEEVAISLVRDTLLTVVKIIKSDQSKFKDSGVQDGFIKYCILALQNDFEENHGEEGENEIKPVSPADVPRLQEFANDGDGKLDFKIKASDDPMFIPDEEEKREEEKSGRESQEEELFLTLTDSEKVGFRYAKETTWPKVTKQIKRIHKMAVPDPEIAAIYEKWLIKNIQLHSQNTKEETVFAKGAAANEEENGKTEGEFEL